MQTFKPTMRILSAVALLICASTSRAETTLDALLAKQVAQEFCNALSAKDFAGAAQLLAFIKSQDMGSTKLESVCDETPTPLTTSPSTTAPSTSKTQTIAQSANQTPASTGADQDKGSNTKPADPDVKGDGKQDQQTVFSTHI